MIPASYFQPLDDSRFTLSGLIPGAYRVRGLVVPGTGTPIGKWWLESIQMSGRDPASWFVTSRRVAAVRTDAQGRYTIRNLPPGDSRAAVAIDLEPNEWFDPDVLQTFLPNAAPLTITGVETRTVDLILR
ncbi:MAG TPA: hypothetical protein VFZ98_06000 [Vicinamibacterales bacterium]